MSRFQSLKRTIFGASVRTLSFSFMLLAAALIFAGSKMKNRESSKEGQTYIAKAGKTTKGITKNSKLGRIDEDIVKSILASSAGTPRPERFRIWHQYFLRELGDFDALRASETLNKIDKLEADGVLRSRNKILCSCWLRRFELEWFNGAIYVRQPFDYYFVRDA